MQIDGMDKTIRMTIRIIIIIMIFRRMMVDRTSIGKEGTNFSDLFDKWI